MTSSWHYLYHMTANDHNACCPCSISRYTDHLVEVTDWKQKDVISLKSLNSELKSIPVGASCQVHSITPCHRYMCCYSNTVVALMACCNEWDEYIFIRLTFHLMTLLYEDFTAAATVHVVTTVQQWFFFIAVLSSQLAWPVTFTLDSESVLLPTSHHLELMVKLCFDLSAAVKWLSNNK